MFPFRFNFAPKHVAAFWRIGLFSLAAILFLARLGERALWSMEVRWGEIPREMLQRGDFLTPTINGHLYYDKPLGSYWLVLAASLFTGGEVNEFAARLPSAVAGLLAVYLTVRIGRRLFDERTGLFAGLVLATSFSFVGFARTASADMENVAGILAALALFLEGGDRPRAWRIIAFWLVMALTSLTKGLLGFALPILIIGVDSLFAGVSARRRWLWHWATPVGVIVAGLVYFTPFLLSADRSTMGSGLGMVFRENVQRFFAPHNHKGPIYLYVYVIFGLLAPWSVVLPAALIHGHTKTGAGAGRRFALVFFWATFAFFTLSASRRSYYLLPILPAAALLIGRVLTARGEELSRGARAAVRMGFAVLAVLVLAAGVAALLPRAMLPGPLADLPAAPAPAAFGVGWVACIAAIAHALLGRTRIGSWVKSIERLHDRSLSPPQSRGEREGQSAHSVNCKPLTGAAVRPALALPLIAIASMAYLYVFALPAVEAYRGQREFADGVRSVVADQRRLALYRNRDIVYYLRPPRDLREFADEAELAAAVRQGEVRFAIVHERDVNRLGVPCRAVVRQSGPSWNSDAVGTRAVLVELNRQED